jgi:UPF0755 protein
VSGQRTLEDWDVDPWDDPMELYEFEAERPRRSHRGLKWIAFSALALAVVAVLLLGAVGMWTLRQINPPGKPGAAVNFTVNQGDDVEAVALRLQDEGIITSSRVFRWYVDRKGGLELTPGYYTVQPKDSMGDILGTLRTPPAQTYVKVTFPEGFTLEQIAKRIESKIPRMTAAAFATEAASGTVRSKYQPDGVTNMEGLLFPDTYQIAGNETEADVLGRMVKLMEQIGGREGLDDSANKLGFTPYQVLTIASLIEREAKVPEDRAMIARVIYNRIFFDMPLQIDASLYYGQDASRPFSELKELDTPYNTYKVKGLPPTPIAMPGRASIRAALNPAPNPRAEDCPDKKPCAWLYYVLADKNGKHVFATNLADQEKNIAKAKADGVL